MASGNNIPRSCAPSAQISRRPLAMLPLLSAWPLTFTPTKKLTQENIEALGILYSEFLWMEEKNLVLHCLANNEKALAWDELEKGKIREDYFEPVKIPTIEHTPWAKCNIPIPPGITDNVMAIICNKVASGIYEPSISLFRLGSQSRRQMAVYG